MSKLNRSWIVLTLLIGLLGMSSIALAEHEPDHPEDTEFSFAYDASDHFLAINIGPNDTTWICDFGDEGIVLKGTYGETLNEDATTPITELKYGGVAWEFGARPNTEVDDSNYEAAGEGDTASYGPEGPCVVNGIVVAGPNGQINHGQVMKAARMHLGIKGGCLVRHLAQSSIGKGTDQVKTSEVDGWIFDELKDGANLDFTTVEADCERGKGKGKGKDKAEVASAKHADKVRGKSAQAPGKTK